MFSTFSPIFTATCSITLLRVYFLSHNNEQQQYGLHAHPDPYRTMGELSLKIFFFQSCEIHFGLKSWGPGPPGPPPLYSFISAKIMRIFTKNDSQRKKNLKANSCQWYQKKWLNSCVFACVCVYKGLKLFWGTGFHLQSKSVSFLWVMILFLHVETGRVWTLFAGASFPLHNVAKKEKNNNLY